MRAYGSAGDPARLALYPARAQPCFRALPLPSRFELRDKQICYTSAWLGTGMYNSSMKAVTERPFAYMLRPCQMYEYQRG